MSEPLALRVAARLRARWPGRRTPVAELLHIDGVVWDLASGERQAGFADWCAAHRDARCRVWLGSESQSDLVCEPGAPIADPRQRREWARRVLVHFHGDAADGWSIVDWRQGRARGASASRVPFARWQAVAAEQGVELVACKPLWPALLHTLLDARPPLRRAATATVGLVEPAGSAAVVTSIDLERGTILRLRRRRMRLDDRRPAIDGLPVADDDGASDPTSVSWIVLGPAPHAPIQPAVALPLPPTGHALRLRSSAPDFLQTIDPAAAPRRVPSRLGWAALAASVVLLGASALDAWQAFMYRERARALASVSRFAPTARADDPTRRASTGSGARTAATDRTLARLAYPWEQIFGTGETAGAVGGLDWLSFEHDAGRGVRLQGHARDEDQPRRAVAALGALPAFSQVLLARQEQIAGGVQSFELLLVPREPKP